MSNCLRGMGELPECANINLDQTQWVIQIILRIFIRLAGRDSIEYPQFKLPDYIDH